MLGETSSSLAYRDLIKFSQKKNKEKQTDKSVNSCKSRIIGYDHKNFPFMESKEGDYTYMQLLL